MRVALSFQVNGKPVSAEVEPDTLLSTFIRENLRLTGTHVGCDTGQCGACTVLVDGRAVKSCNVLAAQMHGSAVTTIEGITPDDGSMHPMQAAFKACHGLQCGFCTPGMVMSAIDLVTHHPHGSEREIREGLEGNFCRCTGYQNIVKAIAQGAKSMGVGARAMSATLRVARASRAGEVRHAGLGRPGARVQRQSLCDCITKTKVEARHGRT